MNSDSDRDANSVDASTRGSEAGATPSDLEIGTFCREKELAHLVGYVTRGLCAPGADGTDPTDEEGNTSLVLLRGGSGMGKSRLFEKTQEAARELDIRVRETFCYERQGIPFLPILRLVKELIEESGERHELWHRYAHVLTRVFPELAGELGSDETLIELPSEDGKVQFFDALTSILGELSQDQPILLVVHDLHRSDRGTVEFIEYLARNAHLSVIGRRTDAAALSVGGESRGWREIRSREGRRGEYFGEGLPIETEEGGTELSCRWMVLANYRGEELPDGGNPVVEAIETLAKEPFAARVNLAPLADTAVSAISLRLLGQEFSAGTSAQVTEATGGNPLHVVEVCRAVEEGADPEALVSEFESASAVEVKAPEESNEKDSKDKSTKEKGAKEKGAKEKERAKEATAAEVLTSTPGDTWVATLFRRRLEKLSDGCRALADVLGVLRRPTPTASLEALLDRSKASIETDLATLREGRFLNTVESKGVERSFLTHEDYVRWTYDAMDDDTRRRLHGRVGRFLSEQERAEEPVRAFEIYEHFRRSETPREALSFGLTAARYFARGYAGELAISILRELIPMLGTTDDAPQRRELLLELSLLEGDHDEIPVAKTHIKEYLEDEELFPEQRVHAVLHLAELYRRLDEPLKGIKALNRLARDVIAEAGGLVPPRISEMRARLRLQRQDPKRAISLCLRGLQELDAIEGDPLEGAPELRAQLQEVLADAHRARGDMVSAIHGYQALLEQVEGLGDDVQLARVLRVVGRVYYDRGNHFRAGRYLFRALEGIRRTQDVRALASTYDLLGKVSRNSGDFVRALEYFRRCLHLRERIGDKSALSPTLNSIGSLYGHNGDYERAIRYFKRSISNAERYTNTAGLVRAFLHLGWVYSDLGERKQVESLAKQILILAQEFNLSDLEGEGHRLQGNLHFFRSQFKEAEREFRRSLEIAQRRGLGKLESAATLDLGMLLSEREEIDGARKRITKGLLLAEELQVVPQQVRGHLLKGDIARHQKGGSEERAIESYRRGLELVAGGTLLPLQFEIEAAMARSHQANLEFEAARECYARADRILEQIASGLPDDMRVVYQDDRRRKNFTDDLQRFRKEATGRATTIPQMLIGPAARGGSTRALPQPESTGTAAFAGVVQALEGLATAQTVEDWARALLAEARRLVPAPRGFLWELTGSEGGRPLAQSDMGPEEEWARGERLPVRLIHASLEEGRALRSSEAGWDEFVKGLTGEAPVRSRSLVVLPIDRPGKFRGALFLERPSASNLFTGPEVTELEQLIALSRGQLTALAQVRELRCFAGTRVLSPAGFDLELDRFVAMLTEQGRDLGTVEATIPGIDVLLRHRSDDTLEQELLTSLGPEEVTAVRLGGDHYLFLLPGVTSEVLRSRRESLVAEFTELRARQRLPEDREVSVVVSSIEAGDADRVEQFRAYGSQLFRTVGFAVDNEISELTESGLTLKEAKTALERRFITSELYKSGGNITRAAESLGVHRPQLSTLIKKHKVKREDFELER